MRKILKWAGAAGLFATALALAFAGYLLFSHSRPLTLPFPTGSYRVGRTQYDWTDSSRTDLLSNQPQEKRELLVWMWYPSDPTGAEQPAAYLPQDWVKAHEADAGIGKYIESRFSSIHTHSFENAPLSDSQSAFPIIVMQPGMGPAAPDYTVFAENLASHGYVVIGVNQTYTSNLIVFPDGRAVLRSGKGTIPDNAGAAAMEADAGRIGEVWAEDAMFVMDKLQDLNADPSSYFHGRLDLEHIGLFGHSFGGATAAIVCKLDMRCKAGADLDGTLFGYQAAGTLQTPFLFVAEDSCGRDCKTMQEAYAASRADVYYLSIEGTRHFNFSDLPLRLLPPARFLFRQVGYIGSISPQRGLEISNAYLLAFFDRYLKGLNAGSLQGPSPAYPEASIEKR